ncbi:Uncharacterised protein [Burkholderia pseudomallei]|nr:Uncharacterised protein [Burkholderia pseudomallei]
MRGDLLRAFDARRVRRHRVELQQQAFGQRARADAGLIERLHEPQRDEQFLLGRMQQRIGRRRELGQRLAQIAVVVERVDDHARERAVAPGELAKAQRVVQMLVQRRLGRHPVAGLEIRRVVGAPARAARRELRRQRHVLAGGRRRVGRERALVALGVAVVRPRVCVGGGRLARLRRGFGSIVVGRLHVFEKRIGIERLTQFLLKLERRKLEQTQRLLQARRERQVLTHLQRERGGHAELPFLDGRWCPDLRNFHTNLATHGANGAFVIGMRPRRCADRRFLQTDAQVLDRGAEGSRPVRMRAAVCSQPVRSRVAVGSRRVRLRADAAGFVASRCLSRTCRPARGAGRT